MEKNKHDNTENPAWNLTIKCKHGWFVCYQTVLCQEHRPDTPILKDLVLSSYAVYRKIQQIAR